MNGGYLSQLLTGLMDKYHIPGAQLSMRHDGRLVNIAEGVLCDGDGDGDPGGVPVREESVFPLGSLTKPFTAILAMTLVADGDAEFDRPVADYMPELAGRADRRLTLRQLLTHTSGLASAADEDEARGATRRRWVPGNCGRAHLVHRPGTVFSYSNIGYIVIGYIIESITAMSWPEAMHTILLRPLDMPAAFVNGREPPAGQIATGHLTRPGQERPRPVPRQTMPELDAPDSALAASAAALVRLVSPESPERDTIGAMCRDQLMGLPAGPFGMAHGWGLGWARYRSAGQDWYGHDGAADGTSCHVRFDVKSGTALALTTNANTGTAAWAELVRTLNAAGLNIATCSPSALAASANAVTGSADCAGRYRNGHSDIAVAVTDDGELELTVDDVICAPLTCYEGLRFTIQGRTAAQPGYMGRFLRDTESGNIDVIQIGGRSARRYTGTGQREPARAAAAQSRL